MLLWVPHFWFALIIIFSSCGFFFFLFLACSQSSQIGCLPYFHAWCSHCANLEFRSESNVMHEARWKYRTQKIAKNLPSAHHRTTLSGYIFATKAYIDNRKKNLLNSNISSTGSDNMVNFGSLTAEIGSRVWGIPARFNEFHVLASLLHRCRATEVNDCGFCTDVWPPPGLVHYIYILGALAPSRNSTRCKIHVASKCCILLYWQHYWTALEQWALAKLRRSAQGATYIQQGGHHVGHRPTF